MTSYEATWKKSDSMQKSAIHLLTADDRKVLGRTIEKRKQNSQPSTQFHTRLFKTHNSNWTPIVHKPSNKQIFKERKELIANWFDLWSDVQRREFFDLILSRSDRRQLVYVHEWFNGRVALRFVDMTTVLPRFLSLYILSFLDPRSLCRASSVSWHWKFLAEQDVLWASKCIRQGWFLPYTPLPHEYGVWKKHYVSCALTLDNELSAAVAGRKVKQSLKSHVSRKHRRRMMAYLMRRNGYDSLDSPLSARPMWLPPDRRPRDLQLSQKALLADYNPNDPHIPPGLLLLHNKFGFLRSSLRHSSPDFRTSLKYSKEGRIIYSEDEDSCDSDTDDEVANMKHITERDFSARKDKLSASLRLESLEERRMMELVGMSALPSTLQKQISRKRPDLSGGAEYPDVTPYGSSVFKKSADLHSTNQNTIHPRVVIISSSVPAVEVLSSALLCGCVLITYQYDSATCETILHQLKERLQGKTAGSIALVLDCSLPDELHITREVCITIDNVDSSDFAQFFETLASHIVTQQSGGSLDIFVPLHSCESGSKLVRHLASTAGMLIRTPCEISSDYRYVSGDWSEAKIGMNSVAPPYLYFCPARLQLWLIAAERLSHACRVASQLLSQFFDRERRDVTAQVIGNIVFSAVDIAGRLALRETSENLLDGILTVSQLRDTSSPLKELARYLLQAEGGSPNSRLSDPRTSLLNGSPVPSSYTAGAMTDITEDTTAVTTNTNPFSSSVTEESSAIGRNGRVDKTESVTPENVAGSSTNATSSRAEYRPESDSVAEDSKLRGVDTAPLLLKSASGPQKSRAAVNFNHSNEISRSVTGFEGTSERRREVDRRKAGARELFTTEQKYLKKLQILESVFHAPLEAALVSNRAIISGHNVTIIFHDVTQLLPLTRHLVSELQQRILDWGAHQTIGDLMVRFTDHLRLYSDYVKNYPVVLTTLEKCAEQSPIFRSFIHRRERTLQTGMLSVAELLLAPVVRAHDYVALLSTLQRNTPSDHVDRNDITEALKRFVELSDLIQQTKLRCERERKLLEIQRTVVGCPILSERKRFFIMQIDVACLDPPLKSVIPELRVYRYKETLGFILFNDALVITKKTSHHVPFDLYKEHVYKFIECKEITRLRVEDIPDSKYAKHGFRMYTLTKEWVCAAENYQMKLEWMEAIESAVRAISSPNRSYSSSRVFLDSDSDD